MRNTEKFDEVGLNSFLGQLFGRHFGIKESSNRLDNNAILIPVALCDRD
jgi:hypothetical protein